MLPVTKRFVFRQIDPGDDKPNDHLLEESRRQATGPEPGDSELVHHGLT